jgi:hypothetical protein
MEMKMMDVKVQIEIVAIVGIISAVALLKGQAELATAGVGGLIGFLGANQLKTA